MISKSSVLCLSTIVCLTAFDATYAASSIELYESSVPTDYTARASVSEQYTRAFLKESIALAPELEKVKPIAQTDFAGWVISNNLIVGSTSQNWAKGFDLVKNRTIWWHKIEGGLSAPAKISGNWALLSDKSGNLYKVDIVTGKEVWKTSVSSFVTSEIAVAGSSCYFVTADQHLYHVNYQSGEVVWLYDGGRPSGLSVRNTAAPLIQKEMVLFGKSDGSVEGVDQKTSKLMFASEVGYSDSDFKDVIGPLNIIGDQIIVSRFDGLLASISIRTGETVWEQKLPPISARSYRQNRLYLGFVNGDVRVYSADKGEQIWRFQGLGSVSQIVVGEKAVYTSSADGNVFAIEPSKGELLWSYSLGGFVNTPPFIYDKAVFFSTGIHHLYGFSIE